MMHSPKVNRSFLLTLTYPSLCVRFEKGAFKSYPKQCNATLNENLATEISSIWTSSRGYQLQVCLWVFWVFFFFSFFFLQHTYLIFQPPSRDYQADELISNDIIITEDVWMYLVRNVSRPLAVLPALHFLISDDLLKKSFKFVKNMLAFKNFLSNELIDSCD